MTVCKGTISNWKKLKSDTKNRLKARANKTRSEKTFIPRERGLSEASEALIRQAAELRNSYSLRIILESLCRSFLSRTLPLNHPLLSRFNSEYPQGSQLNWNLPASVTKEADVLGTVYQSLLSEGEKNKRGSYYTPDNIAKILVKDLKPIAGEHFLDPCCGSGVFLIEALKKGCRVTGCDSDPIAVMIAKANLLLVAPDSKIYPEVFQKDFLVDSDRESLRKFGPFRYSASNPPWGADTLCRFRESASAFFFHTAELLAPGGTLNFLLPNSLLGVRKHKVFREELLNTYKILEIREFLPIFTGVQTAFFSLRVSTDLPSQHIRYRTPDGTLIKVSRNSFDITEQKAFRPVSETDRRILEKIRAKGDLRLKDSRWGLGIVTGNNAETLKVTLDEGLEPIYTGKDIRPYSLRTPSRFIAFEPQRFQQCASEDLYRHAPKIVYKFIGDKLVFALDRQGALFLNSANILIPNVKELSLYAVLGFLNSELFNYLHRMLFNEIKVLRGNLSQLPLPHLKPHENRALSEVVIQVCDGNADAASVDEWIYAYFDLNPEERDYIRNRIAI